MSLVIAVIVGFDNFHIGALKGTLPAAPSRWPMADLVELITTLGAESPRRRVTSTLPRRMWLPPHFLHKA